VLVAGNYVPPPPDVGRLLFDWSPEALPLIGLGLGAALYLAGVVKLHRRGDRWPLGRTAAWLFGLLVIAYATCGGVALYDHALFSAHAVQHMLLATVAPIPLALGAPITLALRALPRRPRRELLWLLHTPVAKVLSFPLVGFVVLVVSMYGLYFSSLYDVSLRSDLVHNLIHAHFLMAGCLFFWPVIGIDPLPGRLPHWARLLLLFLTFPLHALLALAIMNYSEVFASGYYAAHPRSWGTSLLTDQHNGGALMWTAGELVGAMVFVALFVQWSRADERQARREDRQADRSEASGHDELTAYNAYLARLAGRGRPVSTEAAEAERVDTVSASRSTSGPATESAPGPAAAPVAVPPGGNRR
jgi:putative copper resistance protein D